MTTNYSPYSSTPGGEYYYRGGEEGQSQKYASPSPTPSPRGATYYAQTPQRPATRAHFRNASGTGFEFNSPRPPTFSPRYTSDGQYATANVSATRSSRKNSWSSPRPRRERRHSHSYYRASDSHGESDEDELIEINGVTYVIPARSKFKRYSGSGGKEGRYYTFSVGGQATDHHYYAQGGPSTGAFARDAYKDAYYDSPPAQRYEPERRPPPAAAAAAAAGHTRRSSTSVPQRPQTARPSSSHKKAAAAAPKVAKATEADAKKHRIPAGYSLKNWDPSEEPILLLGSVFDSNSLGKWIYDWTVFHHSPATPISDMAGDMWLLLIALSGKVKRSEEALPRIRSKENKDMVDDFIESGERLMDKLRKLLKSCEMPMLKASKKRGGQLGPNAGIEFVETLFGRDRELERTENFMQSVRLWNLRFDANCEEIIKNPTA